jgi:hypothetical protein
MTIAAAGYILRVPPDRRQLLLDEAEDGGSFYRSAPFVAEPVARFEHSRRAPLVVFASFEDGKITHIADGKRGVSAGTGLARLSMQELKELVRPVSFEELVDGVAARVRRHLKLRLESGGLLPPKTLGAFVDRIIELDGSVGGRLARFSEPIRKGIELPESDVIRWPCGRFAGADRWRGRQNIGVRRTGADCATRLI